MEELSEEERWMIVENLLDNLEGLKELNSDPEYDIDDLIQRNEELLDKLAPGWREADFCREASQMTRPIHVGEMEE